MENDYYRDRNVEDLLGGAKNAYEVLSYIEKFSNYGKKQSAINIKIRNMLERENVIELRAFIPHLTLRGGAALNGLKHYMEEMKEK